MFSGYDQHDAQELLKAVLEGINDDLNRVKTKPPYKELKIDPKKTLQQVVNFYKGFPNTLE
jgi:Ubiquitin C-terminal hydrolase